MLRYVKALTICAAAQIVLPSAASAHHFMGGELPGNASQAFLSGLAHPLIGVDHLAFIVAVGVMSQLVGRHAWLPLMFILGTVAGCYAHIQSFSLPWSEFWISASLVLVSIFAFLRWRIPAAVLSAVFFIAGLLHGYAYGESIVGAEPAFVVAYIAGFGLVQYAVAIFSGAVFGMVIGRNLIAETNALRLAAAALVLVATLA